jgi:4-amino-4-deoxy-L-arabinose transferase-like glycosyltransferase
MIKSPKQVRVVVWVGLALIAFVLRVGLATTLPPEQGADAAIYSSIADNLVSGNGYSVNGIDPSRDRPPTYPLFLAAIYLVAGRSIAAVIVVQAFLGVFTVFLTGWLATQVFDRRAGIAAAALAATFPALIYYDSRLLREGFAAFLVIATICSAWRSRSGRTSDYLLTGVCIALVSLCRPETGVLLGPAAFIASGPRLRINQMIRPALFFLIPVMAGWIPWTVRNQQTFGSWSPVKAGIVSTIWYGSRWAETGGDEQTAKDRTALKNEFWKKAEGAGDAGLEERFKQDLSTDILGRPTWFLSMTAKKAVMFWKDANGVKRTLPKIHKTLPVLLNSYYYGLLWLALTALYIGRKNEAVRALAVTIVIYWATYALLHVRNRYRVPLLPIVFILSSGGLLYLFDRIRSAITPKHIASHSE